MLFYDLLCELCLFFGTSENIGIVQEILSESDHRQRETKKEGELYNLNDNLVMLRHCNCKDFSFLKICLHFQKLELEVRQITSQRIEFMGSGRRCFIHDHRQIRLLNKDADNGKDHQCEMLFVESK
jgi:hypothetical protein